MSPPLQVLLVEDDFDLAASVADYLALEQIEVELAYHGQAGLQLALQQHYDVLLLDLMLPRLDGLSLCQQLRAEGVDTPVLMLTARDTLDDKVVGFRAGSDDYLVKPFALEELVMRVRALASRRSGRARRLQVADLCLDLDRHQAWRADQLLKLTPSGWVLLEALVRASPALLSRSQLAQRLWPDSPPDSDALKVHLFHLRQQVDKPFARPLIHTRPGQGVYLQLEEQ